MSRQELLCRVTKPLRPATEADVEQDTKTRKRTKEVAADRVIDGDSFFPRVNDGSTSLAGFGMIVEPSAPE